VEQSGYVDIFSRKNIAAVVNVRQKVDPSGTPTLPKQFRLYGFSVWVPSENVSSGTIFRFYDGDSTVNPSTPLWTMRFWQHGFLGSFGWNSTNMIMQDDSYIQVNNGLYWRLTSGTTTARVGMGITVYL